MRLARKVTIAKWRSTEWASSTMIPADAISIDLRTQENTLSFWKADPVRDRDGEEAVMALVGTLQRLDKIDVVFVDAESLEDVDRVESPGATFFKHLTDQHVDLSNLDLARLSIAAKSIGDQVYGENSRRITRLEVKRIIMQAVSEGKIDVEAMHEKLRAELGL